MPWTSDSIKSQSTVSLLIARRASRRRQSSAQVWGWARRVHKYKSQSHQSLYRRHSRKLWNTAPRSQIFIQIAREIYRSREVFRRPIRNQDRRSSSIFLREARTVSMSKSLILSLQQSSSVYSTRTSQNLTELPCHTRALKSSSPNNQTLRPSWTPASSPTLQHSCLKVSKPQKSSHYPSNTHRATRVRTCTPSKMCNVGR